MATFWTENGQTGEAERSAGSLYGVVRAALRHLYDTVDLQRSVLAAALRTSSHEQVIPGHEARALRKLLIEAIEQLAPGDNIPLRSEERRGYAVLRGLYVDQKPMEALAGEMGLSNRQLRRELHAGLEAVTGLIADELNLRAIEGPALANIERPVQAEIEDFRAESVNLSAEVRSVALLVTPLAHSRNATLEDRVATDNVPVRANRVLLRQTLMALYTWAIETCSAPTLVSEVTVEDQLALFRLCCVGMGGKRQAQLPCIGEPTLEELVGALGGLLKLEQAGSDAALTLRLPCSPMQAILLIDDNRSLHHLFRRYLVGLPYALHSAFDATSGHDMAASLQPDVIILDIMMPDIDGWELLHTLQKDARTSQIPIVICSVLEQRAVAQSLSAVGYLRKPVTQAALLGALRLLSRRNLA